jgi:hypothetical protein
MYWLIGEPLEMGAAQFIVTEFWTEFKTVVGAAGVSGC